jgi:hypothetical protein
MRVEGRTNKQRCLTITDPCGHDRAALARAGKALYSVRQMLSPQGLSRMERLSRCPLFEKACLVDRTLVLL